MGLTGKTTTDCLGWELADTCPVLAVDVLAVWVFSALRADIGF